MAVRPRYKLFPDEGRGLLEIEDLRELESGIEIMMRNAGPGPEADDEAPYIRLATDEAREMHGILGEMLGIDRPSRGSEALRAITEDGSKSLDEAFGGG